MAKSKMTLEEKLEEAIVTDASYDVPKNWVWSRFKNLVTINPKKVDVKGIDDDKECSFIPMNIVDNELGIVNKTELKRLGEVRKGYTNFMEGDIIFAKITPCMENRKSAIVPKLLNNLGYGSTEFHVFRVDNRYINRKYIFYFIRSHEFISDATEAMTGAVGQQRVPKTFIEQYAIPLPPLNEQRRIVDKVEGLFEKLDNAKELIEEARDDFEKRKSAILEKAFRGELTKEWRIKNNITRSEEKSKLSDIVKINPKRDKLTDIDDNKECTFIPMPSVSEITGEVEHPLTEKYSKVKKGYTYFKENDVIFAKITPCMENGKSAIVTDLIDGFGFGSTEFHVIRCNENVINRFIYHLVRAKFFRDIASQHMTGAVGQRRVPKNFLEDYKIILPTVQEQKEIVKILDKLLEEESKIEELTALEEQIKLIKKSILAKAFRGQLGTNCEDDESALELLKEILNKE